MPQPQPLPDPRSRPSDYELTQFDGGAADGAARATEHVVLGRAQTVS